MISFPWTDFGGGAVDMAEIATVMCGLLALCSREWRTGVWVSPSSILSRVSERDRSHPCASGFVSAGHARSSPMIASETTRDNPRYSGIYHIVPQHLVKWPRESSTDSLESRRAGGTGPNSTAHRLSPAIRQTAII